MAKIYKSAVELIGNTPLLELTHIEKKYDLKAKLVAKVEYFNPAGSVKDRIAKEMIEAAEKDGSLKPSYNRLHHLIKEEWHTELDATTDADGYITIEGYKGKYEISANGKKGSFVLSKGGDVVIE